MKIKDYDLIWSFFARNAAFKSDSADAEECCTTPLSRLDLALVKSSTRAGILLYDILETSLSMIHHMEKYIGFRSDFKGDHIPLSKKLLHWSLHYFWQIFEVGPGALSWVKKYWLPNVSLIHESTSFSNAFICKAQLTFNVFSDEH